MRWDYVQFRRVDQQYPGVIQVIRYEDYVTDVNATLARIYGHFHETPHHKVLRTMNKYMRGIIGRVKSPIKHLTQWGNHTIDKDLIEMNRECYDVLRFFNYTYKLDGIKHR